jgi:hypothetical protein
MSEGKNMITKANVVETTIAEHINAIDPDAEITMKGSYCMETVEINGDGYKITAERHNDEDSDNPIDDDFGSGNIYKYGRRSRDGSKEFYKALGLDSDGNRSYENLHVKALTRVKTTQALSQDKVLGGKLRRLAKASRGVNLGKAIADYFNEDFRSSSHAFAGKGNWVTLPENIENALRDFDTLVEESEEKAWVEAQNKGLLQAPFSLSLDIYEHSGISYSLSGHGTQCQFDTSRNGAVWVPCDGALENLMLKFAQKIGLTLNALAGKGFKCSAKSVHDNWDAILLKAQKRTGKTRTEILGIVYEVASEYAESLIELYNQWCNGDVYWVNITATVDDEKESTFDENLSGLYGYDRADEVITEMVKEAFDAAQEAIAARKLALENFVVGYGLAAELRISTN